MITIESRMVSMLSTKYNVIVPGFFCWVLVLTLPYGYHTKEIKYGATYLHT